MVRTVAKSSAEVVDDVVGAEGLHADRVSGCCDPGHLLFEELLPAVRGSCRCCEVLDDEDRPALFVTPADIRSGAWKAARSRDTEKLLRPA